jgi:hypothetical protein
MQVGLAEGIRGEKLSLENFVVLADKLAGQV